MLLMLVWTKCLLIFLQNCSGEGGGELSSDELRDICWYIHFYDRERVIDSHLHFVIFVFVETRWSWWRSGNGGCSCCAVCRGTGSCQRTSCLWTTQSEWYVDRTKWLIIQRKDKTRTCQECSVRSSMMHDTVKPYSLQSILEYERN